MSNIKTLASAYAQGAFDYAKAHQETTQWLAWLKKSETIWEHPEIQLLSRNPGCSPQMLIEVWAAILKLPLKSPFLHFISMLITDRHFEWIPSIIEQFGVLANKEADRMTVLIKSAVPLSKEISRALLDKIEEKTQKKVLATYAQDPELLGGCVIEYGDTVIDLSLRYQMTNLATHLTRV